MQLSKRIRGQLGCCLGVCYPSLHVMHDGCIAAVCVITAVLSLLGLDAISMSAMEDGD